MGGFLGLLFLGGIILLIVNSTKKKNEEKKEKEENERMANEEARKNEEQLLKEMWEEKKKEIETNGLPTLTSVTLNLSKNEFCHFAGDAYFCKIKNQTVGYEGGSRGVSFRVMKGVSFRVGNHRGHYVKQEITEKTDGTIYLTTNKIVFSALKNSSTIKYKDIVNLNVEKEMLQIQTEKKSYLFEIVDSLNFMVIFEHIINNMEEKE